MNITSVVLVCTLFLFIILFYNGEERHVYRAEYNFRCVGKLARLVRVEATSASRHEPRGRMSSERSTSSMCVGKLARFGRVDAMSARRHDSRRRRRLGVDLCVRKIHWGAAFFSHALTCPRWVMSNACFPCVTAHQSNGLIDYSQEKVGLCFLGNPEMAFAPVQPLP
jgi:hypothetical protein